MSTNEGVSARVKELQTAVADGVIVIEVRKRSARVQELQANLDSERSAGDGVGRGSRGDYRHTGQGLPRGFRVDIALLVELRTHQRAGRRRNEPVEEPVEKRKPLYAGAAAGIGIGVGTRTEGLSTGAVSVIDLGASESAVIVAVQDQLGHDSIANMWRSPTRAATSSPSVSTTGSDVKFPAIVTL